MKHTKVIIMTMVTLSLLVASSSNVLAGQGEQRYQRCADTCQDFYRGVSKQACQSGCSNAWGRSESKANDQCYDIKWSRSQISKSSTTSLTMSCLKGVEIK